jgi:GNAT superfamily N-acetyltransferase
VVMGARMQDLQLGEPEGDPADQEEYRSVLEAVGWEAMAAGVQRRYVARRDGHAVGVASGFVHDDTALGLELAVLPAYRRQGIGRGLLAQLLALDVTSVVLGPTPESIAFYRRLGFELGPALTDRCYYLPAGTAAP